MGGRMLQIQVLTKREVEDLGMYGPLTDYQYNKVLEIVHSRMLELGKLENEKDKLHLQKNIEYQKLKDKFPVVAGLFFVLGYVFCAVLNHIGVL
jgi:hypothetical protein